MKERRRVMQNKQGDIRGYRPQPTGAVPVVPPAQQPAPYPPQQPVPQPYHPQNPPPGYVTGNYPPVQQPQMTQPTQPIRSIAENLDWNVVMLLVSALLGVIYALVVTITLSHLGQLIPHMIVAWLSALGAGSASFLRNRWAALGAAIGYVLAMLLFLNYFYWLLLPAILCGVAFMRMEE